MQSKAAVDPRATSLVNVLTFEPDNRTEVLALLAETTDRVISKLKGWVSTSILTGADGRHAVIYSQWNSTEDVRAMQCDPDLRAYFPRIAALASFESVVGDVTYARHA
ncbi:MAG: antibiotic biosynthesis monooxygenase [Steroidobacteraceae bacterium]